jgi:hypothetical protein
MVMIKWNTGGNLWRINSFLKSLLRNSLPFLHPLTLHVASTYSKPCMLCHPTLVSSGQGPCLSITLNWLTFYLAEPKESYNRRMNDLKAIIGCIYWPITTWQARNSSPDNSTTFVMITSDYIAFFPFYLYLSLLAILRPLCTSFSLNLYKNSMWQSLLLSLLYRWGN